MTLRPVQVPAGATHFGALLRQWRAARGMSQLALATEADISNRHLSFLETGRAQPSRSMVQLLGCALDLPLSDRNTLLVAAGFAPAYGQRDLGSPELVPVQRAFAMILRQQEPFPAFVIDAGWNVVMVNEAARRVFAEFRTGVAGVPDHNAMHNLFHPDGIRRFVTNWDELAFALIQTLHREASGGANTAATRLLDELLAYPGTPTRWKTHEPLGKVPPLLALHLRKGEVSAAFFSTITVLHTPQDVTLQQLRVECFHPVDSGTEELARTLAASQ